jgi:hypothetical protein
MSGTEHADMDYHVGSKTCAFLELFRGMVPFEDVKINYHFDPRETTTVVYEDKPERARVVATKELEEFRYNMVKRKIKEARDNKRNFSNGDQFGLQDWQILNEDAEHPQLELWMKPAFFYDLAGLNHCVDVAELDDGKGGKTTVRSAYIKDPSSFRDVLSNNIGCNSSVITEDKYLILMNRGNVNMQYPNAIGVPAGFMSVEKDRIDGVPNPFKTAQRETAEEAGAGVAPDVKDIKLVQIGRPVTGKTGDMHGEISFIIKSKKNHTEVLKAPKSSKYEGKLFAVPFEPKKVAPYMLKPEKWVPAHWAVTAYTLEAEFGMEALAKALDEAQPLPEK